MKIVGLLLFLALVMAPLAGCTSSDGGTHEKDIVVYHSYPRMDGHDPYIVTADGEIFYVENDVVWARLQLPKKSFHILYKNANRLTGCDGRICNGTITSTTEV